MKSFTSAVRSRYSRSMEQRAARLDPDVRRQLAEEIESKLKMQQQQPSDEREEKVREEGEDEEEAAASEDASGKAADAAVAAAAPSSASSRRSQGDDEYGDEEEAEEVDSFEQEEDETDVAIAELDVSLEESRAGLTKSEEAERFLGARVAKYRSMLDERAGRLDRMGAAMEAAEGERDGLLVADESKECDDVERGGAAPQPTEGQLLAMREKHRKDEEALGKVVGMHRNIMADVERMRRKIRDLEEKRGEILDRRDECRDFLVAAAQAEEAEMMAGEGGTAAGVGGCPLTLPTAGRAHGRAGGTEEEKDPEAGVELLPEPQDHGLAGGDGEQSHRLEEGGESQEHDD